MGGLSRTATADYWTQALGLSAEAAYAIELSSQTSIAPLATLNASWAKHSGFSESGAGALDLIGLAQSWTQLDIGLGLEMSHTIAFEQGDLTLEGRAVVQHGLADPVPSQALALSGGASVFTVHGVEAARDQLQIGAGLSFSMTTGMTLHADYQGTLSTKGTGHAASVGVGGKF